ncbi:thioredoxin domain-containing protein [Patescibacteria group bacterium]|nr:thioredoxin domain-containing protein [Patescibacteria group bacterium]
MRKDFEKNNLAQASSPYLRQHKDNPVHWQEWNNKTIAYAKKIGKPLFVSVGYSTCHWCHVMAEEAFSDASVAELLNTHFVSIKVDREERPDIDQFLMSYLVSTQGAGGWPLNAFLTPEGKPFFAGTYFPIAPIHGRSTFSNVIQQVKTWYDQHKGTIVSYHFPTERQRPEMQDAKDLVGRIASSFDAAHGGFGSGPKFPPHNTLLFLLSYFEQTKDAEVSRMITKTLDTMATRGLHDHLQGGFYRYCIDEAWTIPHFEKMLYDQAMLLWVYSLASRLFDADTYTRIVNKIIVCLTGTFEQNALYFSAHDADTDHHEGTTYLWGKGELQTTLTKREYTQFTKIYEITRDGNFEGKNHLIKKKLRFLPTIEEKLLKLRKKRPQPFTDRKIITSLNALLGVGFLMAHRYAGHKTAHKKALRLFDRLIETHYREGSLVHSSLEGRTQAHEFLEDYASTLLFASYIYEETGKHKRVLQSLLKKLQTFTRDGVWYESESRDFVKVPASSFDHPIPSSISLAEFARLRTNLLLGKSNTALSYRSPINFDFANMVAFFAEGNLHEVHAKKRLPWIFLPVNSIQILSSQYQDCYRQTCTPFASSTELTRHLQQFL